MSAGQWVALALSVLALVVSVLSVLQARRAALSAERSLRRTLAAAERADATRRPLEYRLTHRRQGQEE